MNTVKESNSSAKIGESSKELLEGGFFMRCYRCEGSMTYEKFYGAQDHFWGWRCVLCGDVIDPTILENRSGLRASVAAGVRRRWVRVPGSKRR
jgi:hypothetical protein